MYHILRSVLKRYLKIGSLTIIDHTGEISYWGDGSSAEIAVRFKDKAAERAFVRNPELAVGELYMDERLILEKGSIYDFIELALKNTKGQYVGQFSRTLSKLYFYLRRWRQHNTLLNARKNVAHHYDLDDALYRLFLDGDRQYSCAYFDAPDDDLEMAQLKKKRHIAAKLCIEHGHSVLDIGCGWGGMGLYLARNLDAQVTGVTLSKEQHGIANGRAQEMDLTDQARFELRDYRSLDQSFDRIVSVGMFEHVGVGHFSEYFNKCSELLDDDGVMLLHSIGRSEGPSYTSPWIDKYIFPGGYIPALSEVIPHIESAGLVITDIEILRLHYAETLKAWRERFMARLDEARRHYDDRFCRMWEFYLAASETAFRYQGLMVFQIQIAKKHTAVPLTRNYIERVEKELASIDSHPSELRAAE